MGPPGTRWCAAAALAASLIGCGGSTNTSTAQNTVPASSSPTASAQPPSMATSTVPGTPSASAGPASTTTLTATATAGQLVAVVEQVYVREAGGDYAACDAGSDMSFPRCPFTDRLRARVAEIYAQQRASPGPGHGDAVCGCQNYSHDLKTVATPDDAGGGDVRVSLFGGSDHINVLIVAQGGRLLVDELVFCSADPPSSIYAGTAARC